jgi:regulator of nucleoside diphosphate kinase
MFPRVQSGDAEGQRRTLVVCYPADADADAGRVSVLSPLGAALLGHRAGETVSWRTPDGREHLTRIEAVEYQPEASGDFVT